MNVRISIKPEDMPGRPLKKDSMRYMRRICSGYGEIHKNGRVLCKPCIGAKINTQLKTSPDGK